MLERARSHAHGQLANRTLLAWLAFLVVPVSCLLLPGAGVLIAALWTVVLVSLLPQGVTAVGYRRPSGWLRLIGLALTISTVIYFVDGYIATPLVEQLLGKKKDLSAFDGLHGNWAMFLGLLLLGWLAGGILEELVFRGFIINIGTRLTGVWFTWPLAILGSLVFGLSHLYQGTVGVITTAVVSFLFSVVFIVSRRDLLLSILVHGFVNTLALSLAFFGIARLV